MKRKNRAASAIRYPWGIPIEAQPKHVDFIHPWMPRDIQHLRQRVADALGLNYYDMEPLFTGRNDEPRRR